jgi:hypothetical protein
VRSQLALLLQSFRDAFAINSLLIRNHFAIYAQWFCNRWHSLHDRSAIVAQSLRNQCAVMAQSMCIHGAIMAQ